MLASTLLTLLSLFLFFIACFAFRDWGKNKDRTARGVGRATAVFGTLFAVLSLLQMRNEAPKESPSGYGARFSDTTWTTVTVISVGSDKVRLLDLASVREEPYRAVFYEMSSKSFSGNVAETLTYGAIHLIRVVKSPEGLSHIEVK